MRKKRIPAHDPVVSSEILEKAKEAVQSDQLKRTSKCAVCGAECQPNASEQLCWVCRRLKISAWHEGEQQVSAQE